MFEELHRNSIFSGVCLSVSLRAISLSPNFHDEDIQVFSVIK